VNRPLPNNGVIRIAFDRYINPLTLNRQGIALRDLFGNAPDSPIIQYDPVTRTATLSNPGPDPNWLVEGATYEVSFPIATDEAGSFGLRAIDGATMDPATQKIAFVVVPAVPNLVTKPPTIDYCKDIQPLFAATHTTDPTTSYEQGACSNVHCHAGTSGAQGLDLSTAAGVRNTAIGILATEAANAALSIPITAQNSFPVGMPIIDPGDPGHSFLIYKLLLPDVNGAPDGGGAGFSYTITCGSPTPPFDYGPSPGLASPDEATRLSQFVVGRRMPWGDPAPPTFTTNGGTPLTLDELERISTWILQGAPVVDGCPALCSPTH
jgi:hypothetical protein